MTRKRYPADDRRDYAAEYARKKARGIKKKSRAKPRDQWPAHVQPFEGCDGEGIGRAGRHRYVLFRMGDRELYRRGRGLKTWELLDFICDHPLGSILVWFAGDYDTSMILRDVKRTTNPETHVPSELERILSYDMARLRGDPNPFAAAGWVFLSFQVSRWETKRFGVRYFPGREFSVVRAERFTFEHIPGFFLKPPWNFVDGRATGQEPRTIYNVSNTFAGLDFLSAIRENGVGRGHWHQLKTMKDRRAKFDRSRLAEIRPYNALECGDLAQLMERHRSNCHALALYPKKWTGPGAVASFMLDAHGAMKRAEVEALTPEPVLASAAAAFYAGRFEGSRVGFVRPCWFADINSAFASAMLKLPCLRHGTWRKASAAELVQAGDDSTYVCSARFSHPRDQFLGGLVVRDKEGRLSWPRQGQGVYWSVELHSAERRGAFVKRSAGWLFERACDCDPLAWVEPWYVKRLALTAAEGRPIRTGLQAVWGKFAERMGEPPYRNLIWAGLVTARIRAIINAAIAATGERNIAMVAADGLFATARPVVNEGDGLGQWRVKEYPAGMFIVRPGLYWPLQASRKAKDRHVIKSSGIGRKFFGRRLTAFEGSWRRFLKGADPLAEPEPVTVKLETFLGLRQALRRGTPEKACNWKTLEVECNFDWQHKRSIERFDGAMLVLGSLAGSPALRSEAYDMTGRRPDFDLKYEEDRAKTDVRFLTESTPDVTDFSPFRD